MKGKIESGILQVRPQCASHIPIPYGCLSVVAIILAVLATLAASSLAIGIAILK